MDDTFVNAPSAQSGCKTYLWNWREILAALGMRNNAENRRRVREATTNFSGPIVLPTKGGQPKVCKERLLLWWNSLEQCFCEQEQKQLDASASVAASYKHGKEATVLPDIAGHVKKRRQS
jgi:hypothetical protein